MAFPQIIKNCTTKGKLSKYNKVVQGGFAHGTAYNLTVNAWPFLAIATAIVDTDKDGMPDSWETSKKLNPNDGSDAKSFNLSTGYSNIEVYLNNLTQGSY